MVVYTRQLSMFPIKFRTPNICTMSLKCLDLTCNQNTNLKFTPEKIRKFAISFIHFFFQKTVLWVSFTNTMTVCVTNMDVRHIILKNNKQNTKGSINMIPLLNH